ncbi:MAG: GNAT family N-acetyltransferase [Verrucomicrobia bacterium]|nr:GNAT family N-acetyltransferase [Verrucomicrobiota bacterium]
MADFGRLGKVRTTREIELRDITELFRVRSATDENRLTREELAALGITESSVKEKLLGTWKGWLCEENGTVVGFAIGDKSSGEMWVIAVLPSHIRQGIGGRLLTTVESWLFAAGCSEIWLTTDIDVQLRAYSFYRNRGWTDWKIEKGNRYMKKRPNQSAPPTPGSITPRATE